MRIVTLMENTSCREDLTAEHGLSLYIETGEYRILFDAGQTGAFADNAEKLGIDLSKVDLAVLSHGHYDHGGGLRRFLEINKTAPVWMNPHAFGEHYNGSEKYIGLDPALAKSGRIRYAENERTIGPGMTLFTRIPCPELTGKALHDHANRLFQMYSGDALDVKMRFHRSLLNVVIDRFGKDTMLIPDGEDYFNFTVKVAISPMFLSWIIGFGAKAKILYPRSVADACKALCLEAMSQYED